MEATKKLTGKSVKKWLGNNAIIVLMLLVSLFVGIIHPNFFARANLINLFKNADRSPPHILHFSAIIDRPPQLVS